MRTNETISVRGAIHVTKTALEDINRVLETIASELWAKYNATVVAPDAFATYWGTLVDGARVEFASFEELIGYPNRAGREITRLHARLRDVFPGHGFSLEITLGGLVPCVVEISGDLKDALHAKELCQDIIARIRAGHSWVHRVSWYTLLILISPILTLVLPLGFASRFFESTRFGSEQQFYVFMGWVSAGFFALAMVTAVSQSLWPRVVFAIGQQIERNESRVVRRRWLITGLALAVLVSLFSRYIGTRMGL